jgi:excisionase family DNA binding protein
MAETIDLEHDDRSQNCTERLVYTVPEAGRLLGLSRNGAYAAAQRGEIPTIRIGRLLLVPKGPFHRMVELLAVGTAVPAERSDPGAEVAKAKK